MGIFPIATGQSVVPRTIESFQAVWDTGATNTAIASSVVSKLKLAPISFTKVGTGGGQVDAPVYLINVVLPNNVILTNVQVTELPALANCDVLVGMDIITQGDFAITHMNGQTSFSFRMPPSQHIDFVPDSNVHNMRLGARMSGVVGRVNSARHRKKLKRKPRPNRRKVKKKK